MHVADSDRIRCALARFIGLGYVFYFAVSVPEFVRDSIVVDKWWTPVAIALAFGPGLVLLAGGVARRARLIRIVGPVCALSYLACLILWAFAWNGLHVEADRSTWLFTFPGVATLAGSLGWRWPWVATHLVVASVGATVVNSLGRSTTYSLGFLPIDVLFGISFIALFAGASVAAIRTAEDLDKTRKNAYAKAAHEVETATRAGERARYDRIVHDQVLHTLLLASKPTKIEGIATAATRSLAALNRPPPRAAAEEPVSSSTLATTLRESLHAVDADTPIHVHAPLDLDTARYPSAVLRAFEGAAGEALRNSLKHAGDGAGRDVVIDMTSDTIELVIADSGVGFDPERIPAGRLGVRGSIAECMSAIDGGSFAIHSVPSVVTAVQLRWDRP